MRPISRAFNPRHVARINHDLRDQHDSGLSGGQDNDLFGLRPDTAVFGNVFQQRLLQAEIVVRPVSLPERVTSRTP